LNGLVREEYEPMSFLAILMTIVLAVMAGLLDFLVLTS
jgi:hypothetical protein